MIKNIHFILNKFETTYYLSALLKKIMTLKTNSVMSFFMVGIVLLVFPVKLALNQWVTYTCIILWFAFAYYLDYDYDVQVIEPEDTELEEFLKDREKAKKKTERPLHKRESEVACRIKNAILEISSENLKNDIIRAVLCNPILINHATEGNGDWDTMDDNIYKAWELKEAHEVFHNIIESHCEDIKNNMGSIYVENYGLVPCILPPLQRVLLPQVTDEQSKFWEIKLFPLQKPVKITLGPGFWDGGYRGPYEPKAYESK